ncbi:tRNA lysidine(34) synthetase TilS [Bifidobacterium sp.]|jgi:tRNA(Ile)-lysidine synthase|uniref:tRNA lysidine(34) synthetase TilS n=1 Tax=Bifidobacterium sp. TaxID=41200 RepID=UPI0025C41B68|nr:tRNA lysidine(34) synthetase TilS [Bifidobacterium sp.]MCH4210076.1 tRNA lysidine(34) synthetase TilS [Bifidobacterium sp.]MCI1225512.1 tRNA lysidine(34) synthetase TilS [Bifidobacterium sp.]
MVYTQRLKAAAGGVRLALARLGIRRQGERFIRHGEHEPSTDAPLVLIACSGGRDSIALAAVSHIVCGSLGLRCGAIVVDHGLQQGSAQVARQAADRCRAVGLSPVEIETVHVRQQGQGVEAAARQERYQALASIARRLDAAAVLLAHTKSDQAETVVIGLLRSGGLDALAGMPRSFVLQGVRFARPLLDITRAQTTGICQDLGLQWWDDPTNGGDGGGEAMLPGDYPLRSRIRHNLIPYLERFTGADVISHLADMALFARDDKEYLDMQADRLAALAVSEDNGRAESPALRLAVGMLADEHVAVRRRVIAHALASLGITTTSRHVEAVDRLVSDWHGQGPISLPSGYTATRQKHVIRLCQDGGHANR